MNDTFSSLYIFSAYLLIVVRVFLVVVLLLFVQRIEKPFLSAVQTTLGDRYTENVEGIYKQTIKFIIETLVTGFESANTKNNAAAINSNSNSTAADAKSWKESQLPLCVAAPPQPLPSQQPASSSCEYRRITLYKRFISFSSSFFMMIYCLSWKSIHQSTNSYWVSVFVTLLFWFISLCKRSDTHTHSYTEHTHTYMYTWTAEQPIYANWEQRENSFAL